MRRKLPWVEYVISFKIVELSFVVYPHTFKNLLLLVDQLWMWYMYLTGYTRLDLAVDFKHYQDNIV